jgi:hypothetical protein
MCGGRVATSPCGNYSQPKLAHVGAIASKSNDFPRSMVEGVSMVCTRAFNSVLSSETLIYTVLEHTRILYEKP